MVRLDESALFLAVALEILALSSIAFHSGGEEHRTPAHRLDEGSMYGVIGVLGYHAWGSLTPILMIVGLLLVIVFLNLDKVDSMIVIPVSGLVITIGLIVTASTLWALAALGAGIIAWTLRILPQTDVIHGLWHTTIAGAIFLAWYVSLQVV